MKNQEQVDETNQNQKKYKKPAVHRMGKKYNQADIAFLIQLIQKATKQMQNDIQKQAQFIQFYLNEKRGQHHQIFIYNFFDAQVGHIFYSDTEEYANIKYQNYNYYIWKIKYVQ